MNNNALRYHGYRFPAEIISHAVWLYYRFCLSFRDVEDLLAARGITVSYETMRQRERQMRGFKSVAQAQRFWSVHGVIQNLFRVGRHLLRSANHRMLRARSILVWHEVTCA
jgi:transposase-like protein